MSHRGSGALTIAQPDRVILGLVCLPKNVLGMQTLRPLPTHAESETAVGPAVWVSAAPPGDADTGRV